MKQFLSLAVVLFASIAFADDAPRECCQAVQVVDAVKDAAQEKTYATGRKEAKNKQFLKAESAQRHAKMLADLPNATERQFDLRQLKNVPPVKGQRSCGSCWDFSGVAVCESAMIAAGIGKDDGSFRLSEQFVLDCGSNGGCSGDDNTTVLQMCKAKGLVTEQEYGPYVAREQRCQFNSKMKLLKISDWGFCYPDNDQSVSPVQRIKNCMKAFGVIGCAIAADQRFMNTRPGEVFRGNASGINHDVALVGWDDDKGAWILRNSWGGDWCDNGYCYIAYGANQVGYEAVWATCGVGPTPVPPTPVPPTPVPPGPPAPPAPPGSVTIVLTAEQVQSVISQGGAIRVRPEMTVAELLRVIAPQKMPPASCMEPEVRMPSGPVSPFPLAPAPIMETVTYPSMQYQQGGCPGGVCPAPVQQQQGGFIRRWFRR